MPVRKPTSSELLHKFINTNLPDFSAMLAASSNMTSKEQKEELLGELRREFFMSPNDKKGSDADYQMLLPEEMAAMDMSPSNGGGLINAI